ncbi:ribosomal L7Ae/L30e/S12e/Gadd45 family protein [Candidatus Woesearchaeota archaeon]|nr:ribosomal L7Ae/L30e/S12e/Gadd45 family protein [Candidatus Woesearchaeota archaeon]
MAKATIESKNVTDLKTKLLDGKVTIGLDLVLKNLKKGILGKVLLAKNCPEKIKKDLHYYAQLQGTAVEELELSNEELGILCKKNFFIAVAGILKE